MNKIWEKLNEHTRKIASRRSSRGTKARTITSTYYSTADEFYIGVSSEKPVTVYLPATPSNGKIIIIKAEMTPPLGNRKITIATTDGSTIDGYSDVTITVSHDCKRFIYNNKGWRIC